MNEICIKPKRIELILRFFTVCFFGVVVTVILQHGIPSLVTLFKCLLISLAFAACSMFIPLTVFKIVISDDQVTVPVKNGILYKPVSIPIYDILLSNRWKDHILSSEISTSDGWTIPISGIFFSRNQKKIVIEEIRKRTELIRDKVRCVEVKQD